MTLSSFSLELLHSIVELAPIGVLIIDPDGVIEEANRYMCDLTGYSRDELIGKQVEILVPGRLREAHVGLRQSFMKTPTHRMMGHNRELACVDKMGREIPIEVGLAPVDDRDHRHIVVTVTNVTLKREGERKLRALAGELEEISTPVLEVWDKIAVVPIIGTLDSTRAQRLMENTLNHMSRERTQITILDITGMTSVDTALANHLLRLTAAIRLMGGLAVLTGISPETAKTLVRLGVDLGSIDTKPTLAGGLKFAIQKLADELG